MPESEVLQPSERLLRLAAHDLREPLYTARHYLDLLSANAEFSDEARDWLDFVRAALDRIHAVVREELRESEGPSVVAEPAAVLEEALADVEGVRQEREAVVQVGVVESAVLRIAPADLRRVLQNLVAHGIRHGGDPPHVHVAGMRMGGRYVFAVENDGAEGDNPAEQEATTAGEQEPEGHGLGLLSCRHLLAQWGGELEGGVNPGGGFRFKASLPCPV